MSPQPAPLNLVKLCVGSDGVDDLAAWQASQRARWPDGNPVHVTRMWPRREAELLPDGALYWVFRGVILARQRILRLEERRGEDGILRCGIVLSPEILRTEPAPRRAFQGWRYLAGADAPRDLPGARSSDDALPPQIAAALAEMGLR